MIVLAAASTIAVEFQAAGIVYLSSVATSVKEPGGVF